MLKDYTPEELSYLATTFAVAITKGMDILSIRVLCSFFTNVIGTLSLIINQRILNDAPLEKKPLTKPAEKVIEKTLEKPLGIPPEKKL